MPTSSEKVVSNDITLRFNQLSKKYKQGFVLFDIELINNREEKTTLSKWNNEFVANNFSVIAKNKQGEILPFNTSSPMSSVFYSNCYLRGKESKKLQLSFICNLPPGEYQIQAFLIYHSKIRTKWHSIVVVKGKLVDLRK